MGKGLSLIVRDWLLEPVLSHFDQLNNRLDAIERRLIRMVNQQEQDLQTIVSQLKGGQASIATAISDANARVLAKIQTLSENNPHLADEFAELSSIVTEQNNAVAALQTLGDEPVATDPTATS